MRAGKPLPARAPEQVWVVAADRARARIFRAQPGGRRLVELEDLLNPQARVKPRRIVSDRYGRARNAAGGSSTLNRRIGVVEQNALDFAHLIGGRLVRAAHEGDAQRFYLVATPRFLGLLRKELDAPTRKLVAGEVGRDMTRHRVDSIRRRLPEQL